MLPKAARALLNTAFVFQPALTFSHIIRKNCVCLEHLYLTYEEHKGRQEWESRDQLAGLCNHPGWAQGAGGQFIYNSPRLGL